MVFTQLEFLLLVVAVLVCMATVPNLRLKKVLLLASSYYFYAYWDARFLGLILLSTAVDYFVGRGLGRTDDDLKRKALLSLSIAVNLGLLGFFKYAGFFVASFDAAFGPILGRGRAEEEGDHHQAGSMHRRHKKRPYGQLPWSDSHPAVAWVTMANELVAAQPDQ